MPLMPVADAAWSLVLYVVPFVAVLSAIVFVHELGHFLAARWCRVRVSTFSLGVGRELASFTDRHGTRWRLAALPLGGYVNFVRRPASGSEAEPAVEPGECELRRAPLRHRALIVAAGPFANFLLTFVLFVLLGLAVGTRHIAARIGFVEPGSTAAAAGLLVGDVVTAMNGRAVTQWSDIERVLSGSSERRITMTVERGDRQLDVTLTPRMVVREAGAGRSVHVPSIGVDSDIPAVIGRVAPGQPAAVAGLAPGDRVLAVDGRPVGNFRELVTAVSANPARPIAMSVLRGGETLHLTATPSRATRLDADGRPQVVGRLGVAVEPPPPHRLGPVAAIAYGARETAYATTQTLAVLGTLFTSRDAAEQVGGPLLMAEATAEVVKLGPATLVMWMAILSANLGLFNLLPIPVLDGGHLMFHALEAIRRRPLSPRVEAMGLKLGLALIGCMIVLVNLADLFRLGKRLLG